MIIHCKECNLQVSDKAMMCPHCGFPMNKSVKNITTKPKRMRLPNGFGQISEIKNRNLREPFRAMVTVGKDPNGKPIQKILKPKGYFKTYNEAYAALVEYNKNPYDLDSSILVSELYEKWSKYYFNTLKSRSSERTITSAWAYCSSLYSMRAKDVRVRHLKLCIEEGYTKKDAKKIFPSANTKSRMKSIFNLMFDYAVEYEIVDKNYARDFVISGDIVDETNKSKNSHLSFTDEEMKMLWNNVNNIPYVDVVLIQCYSGWRPQELGLLRRENVDLENWTFKGGMKTEAGTDRIVPIHSKIRDLVKKRYDMSLSLGSEYLINCTDTHTHRSSYFMTYDKYEDRFKKIRIMLNLNPKHRPHDPRKQFVTMAKNSGVDEYAIKYMAGHSISDITEKVYTDRNINWLKDEIEKISV